MVTSRKLTAEHCKSLLKVRAKIFDEARTWLNNQGFTEVQGPMLLPASGAGANSFKVSYFDQDAFLARGLSPYSDFFTEALGKIYTTSPTFRADSEDDGRHLAEYWRIEANASNYQYEDILSLQEQLLKRILSKLLENNTEELVCLTGSLSHIERIKLPLPRLTYDEAIESLQKKGWNVFWGQPLHRKTEHELSLAFDQPFFITNFPLSGEWFAYEPVKGKDHLTQSYDLLAPEGYGELASGGQLITKKELLINNLRGSHIDPENLNWYLSLRKFDSIPRSGFALGIERFIQWVCRLENIQETTAFPRTYGKNYP